MSRKWFLWRALAALVCVGLLTVGGLALYRAGWSQGYVAGQLGGEGEDVVAVPYPHYGFGYGYVWRPFGFAPFLLGAGLLFLLFFAASTLFRLLAWKKMMAAGGPWPVAAHWGRHWRRFGGPMPHGPVPPWCWWGEMPGKTGPDANTGAAEAEG